MILWRFFLGIYGGRMILHLMVSCPVAFPANRLMPAWHFKSRMSWIFLRIISELRNKDLTLWNKDYCFSPLLWQGHSVRRRQSHDRAECGDCVWSDSAPAWDGVSKHRHAHGLPESDCGVHLKRIRSPLPLQLEGQQSQTCTNVYVFRGLSFSLVCT